MSFLLCFYCMMQVLSQQVIWTNTVVEIPVGESLTTYIDMPEASLYIGGVLVVDEGMYYVKDGVERTFLSTVNTHIVRSYEIKYRVHFPKYHVVYTQAIIFDVVDNIPPTVEKLPEFSIPLGSKLPDLKQGLIISDNYDPVSSLEVTIESHHIIINKVGIYPIYYHIKDRSGHITSAVTTIEIYDPLPPEITLKKPVILEYGHPFEWRDYFQIKDNVDVMLDIYVYDHMINYDQLGTYAFSIEAVDQSGLSSIYHTTMTIIDSVKPVIRLTTQPKPLSIFKTVTEDILLEYVVMVSDNYDLLSKSDIKIIHDIDIYRLGEYLVTYFIEDSSKNAISVQLKLKVVDDEPPTIEMHTPLVFNVFDPTPQWIQYFTLFDNYDMPYDLSVSIKGTCDMKKVGTYPMTIEAIDKATNKTVFAFDCIILDVIPPSITLKSEIIITNYQKTELLHYFEVSDNYDQLNLLNIKINDDHVSYDHIGHYDILVCVSDQSLNETCITASVMIIDITPPSLKLSRSFITIDIKEISIDPTAWIDEASDDYDYLTISDVEITHNIVFQKIGRYEVIYTLYDHAMNQAKEVLIVIIDALDVLDIIAPNFTLNLYDPIDPLLGIEVTGSDIAYDITYDMSHMTPTISGVYQVTYVLTDIRGQTYVFSRNITILPETPKPHIKHYIPILGINVFLGALLFILYKRR